MSNSQNTEIFHVPVLLKESIDGLNVLSDGIYVDVTFGGGSYSKQILSALGDGKLFVFDQDEDAFKNRINDDRIIYIKHNFRFLKYFLKYHQIEKIDGLVADLGVSSNQFDTDYKGFSYRTDGPLDMRMNKKASISAKEVVNNFHENDLKRIFWKYGEIKNTNKLVKQICEYRASNKIESINNFLDSISPCVPKINDYKYLSKVFQAIRIEVNDELTSLKELLMQTKDLLKINGRVSIVSYHSAEDKIVKNFFKSGNFEGIVKKDLYGNKIVDIEPVNTKVIVPDEFEIEKNKRSRSGKLRIAKKIL
ncbi:MAG: 16S rRNA (cytosine(1402)-N(4))-methyltransferase RsmH [Bacteroidetes bacterium]|jgi:16S rRNA (cytosine1402-N4)-methyltransferase|nr:16S rRNA (cytosine(1402)-N(4))-methyltransferase RsmH [Bacteroidota bacterium]MBT6684743.1 16S rRNA (cytosine(1402)-N(4))-methyltransferase RsmH [Bacteroidota bacterium]MBT7143844.1 16S rRNA (cytosine(1402)-N(4))-methyltransferase RsmH [Bacteroidota bacterium]MBT7489975.1 16S rRNA (cytosine(1402)-N(4))-methyltransferase RsmH [Bacteroidota bacterium]